MSYQKQPELNGAYYGPSIPPPTRRSHRPGRGPGGCCCLFDCLCDCGCCLLSCVFKIIFSIIITIGIIVLILWLILHPNAPKFHASDATLTTFNLTASPGGAATLASYNLAVNFTVRNPNKRIAIYYDRIEANVVYGGQRLSTVNAVENTVYQGHKNTTYVGPVVFSGRNQAVSMDSDGKEKFLKESNDDGVYEIVVKMNLRVRFKVGLFKFGTYKPKVRCNLEVPLQGKSTHKFQETRCHYSR